MRLYFHTISTTSNARAVDVEPQRTENRKQITLTPTGEASGAPKLRQSTDSIASDSDSPRTSSTGGRKIRKTKTRTGTASRNAGPNVASGSVGITNKTQPGQPSAQVLRREKTSDATHFSSSLSHRGATHASLAARSEVVDSEQVLYSATAKGGETLVPIEQLVATQSSDFGGNDYSASPLLYERGMSTRWSENPHGQHVCSHNNNTVDNGGWWRLEFKDGKKHCLSKMEIWNRYDCCQARLNNGFVLLDPDVDDPVTK
ncbi:unnamed protein product [Amoebophrya sp. A120]|nr:unnamed protein product [Amoebophrya sp. A120]|eukprot:GSA120T00002935001.1